MHEFPMFGERKSEESRCARHISENSMNSQGICIVFLGVQGGDVVSLTTFRFDIAKCHFSESDLFRSQKHHFAAGIVGVAKSYLFCNGFGVKMYYSGHVWRILRKCTFQQTWCF